MPHAPSPPKGIPLKVLSYEELYGWSMDAIVRQIGTKNNCTFCGVFRWACRRLPLSTGNGASRRLQATDAATELRGGAYEVPAGPKQRRHPFEHSLPPNPTGPAGARRWTAARR